MYYKLIWFFYCKFILVIHLGEKKCHMLPDIHAVENSGLPKGCVLSRILQVQMLDMMDIDGIYPLYLRVQQHLEEFTKDRSVGIM